MSSEEVSATKPTTRFSIYVLSATLILAAGFIEREYRYVYFALSMILLLVFLRGYTEISLTILSRMSIRREIEGSLEGGEVSVIFYLENKSLIPVLFAELFIDHTPHLMRISPQRFLLIFLPKSISRVRIVFRGRIGLHRIGPVKIVLRDPLGLFRSREVIVHEPFYVRISPRVTQSALTRIYSFARSIGASRSRKAGEGVEFMYVREYRPGDEPRRVFWKAFAKTGRLVIKEMERESSLRILYLLIASEEMFEGVYGSTPYEQIARVITSVSRYLTSRSDPQAIIMVTPAGSSFMSSFMRGAEGFNEILRILTSIDYESIFLRDHAEKISEETFAVRIEYLVKKLIDLLGREKTVVFIFSDPVAASTKSFENLIIFLRGSGHSVNVLIPLRSLYDIGFAKDLSSLIYRIKIFDEIKRETSVAKKYRSFGVNTVILRPDQMIHSIVREIEYQRY